MIGATAHIASRTSAPAHFVRRRLGQETVADARESFLYFNNDPTGAAIRDARTMIELLRDHGLAA